MFTNHFLLKLLLAPLIIAAATLVSRRWGERVGGLMIGLPLTSAPVSVFFAVEQGQKFAASAALGSLLGMVPVAVFCLAYVQAARRFRWYVAALFSIAAYLLVVWAVSYLPFGLGEAAIGVPVVLGLALLAIGQPQGKTQPLAPPWWDLPARMGIAAVLLVLLTALAAAWGRSGAGCCRPSRSFRSLWPPSPTPRAARGQPGASCAAC